MPTATLASRVTWALEFVGLADRRQDRVETYSGGMKRRLNLAAAILHDPDLVLLDEPTVGVDPQSRNSIFDSLLALKAAGKTIVYTTHYMEEAERLCDRVAIMDHGKLLALDTVRGLTATHGGPPTLILRTPAGEERIETREPLAELNRQAAARGIGDAGGVRGGVADARAGLPAPDGPFDSRLIAADVFPKEAKDTLWLPCWRLRSRISRCCSGSRRRSSSRWSGRCSSR